MPSIDHNVIEALIDNFSLDNLHTLFRQKSRSYKRLDSDLPGYNIDDFTNCRLLGQLKLGEDEGELLVFSAKISGELSERSSRKRQFELGKKVLRENPGYAGGFFTFYDTKGDFRISFIYSIPQPDGRLNYSNFRRYTYFVSKHQPHRTFVEQMLASDFISLQDIIDAFSVEKVTKEFYKQIANWYDWAAELVQFPSYSPDTTPEQGRKIAVIRMLTRLFFIWFMKEKKVVKDELFEEVHIARILKDFDPLDSASGTYYKAILQNLFFATLNTPVKDRRFRKPDSYQGHNPHYLNPHYYRYHSLFRDPDQMESLFKQIPFLNGGLFECLDFGPRTPQNPSDNELRLDGFSDHPAKQAFVPNLLFFDADKGLLSIFKRYNFTIEENTPFDQQIALDPEMLGKVFENLLATYNPETSTTARRATGSYYTPREIVDYMVSESILHYLKNKLLSSGMGGNPEMLEARLRQLLSYDDEPHDFSDTETETLITAIHSLKIIDPAVGSGAFPMGALHKLVHILHKLDPHNERWKEQQIKALDNLTDTSLKQKLIEKIEENFKANELDYGRKLYLIQNCIYGVDIQPIAIHIAKLRFFISLLVDEKVDELKENWGIEPLPNLETKFVAANTLIPLFSSAQGTLKSDSLINLEQKLKRVRSQYFVANVSEEKESLKAEDKKLREKIRKELELQGYPSASLEKIADWDPYDTHTSAGWFDPEWMFGVADGFDIVIGNPPYIQLQRDGGKLAKIYENLNYETFARTGDIYTLFYEKGIQLLKTRGILCFITSNKWMRAAYGHKLRKFFTQYQPLVLIDLGPGVFESATVDTNILLIQKQKTNTFRLKALKLESTQKQGIEEQVQSNHIILSQLSHDAWVIGSLAELRLKEKIERIGKPLRDWDVKIYRGILTGLNEAFIITTEKREEILKQCRDEEERRRTEAIIKPILRGRDIKRYYHEWAGLWVIMIPAGWTNENKDTLHPAKFINEYFPALMKYLKPFEERARQRDDQGDYWWELRPCAYYKEFEKEKIIYIEIMTDNWAEGYKFPSFTYWRDNGVVLNTAYIMTGSKLKYILGVINSKLGNYLVKKHVTQLQRRQFRMLAQYVNNFEIPSLTPFNVQIVNAIEDIVDSILTAKEQNSQADTIHWEREIDRLVYELYELTDEEIKIVEGSEN